MPGLPQPWARALDAALVSLSAFQALDYLVRRHPAPVTLADAIAATGLHVGEAAHALSDLTSRGVLTAASDGMRLAPTYADALAAAWPHMDQRPELRRHALRLASERGCTPQVIVQITFAPPLPATGAPRPTSARVVRSGVAETAAQRGAALTSTDGERG